MKFKIKLTWNFFLLILFLAFGDLRFWKKDFRQQFYFKFHLFHSTFKTSVASDARWFLKYTTRSIHARWRVALWKFPHVETFELIGALVIYI